MKRCAKCSLQFSGNQSICNDCFDATQLLKEDDTHSPPLATSDDTLTIHDVTNSTSLNENAPIAPITPIVNNVLHDRYKIESILGKGGMGTVYLAKDLRLNGKLLAIKEVTINTTESDAFIDEAKMLVQLEHSNLPKITDYFPPSEHGQAYLVMDYIKGNTLSNIFKQHQKQIDFKKIMKYTIQICNLLNYLHSHKPAIIYRDLKPSNIMIDHQDNVQLIDFGIARKYQEGKHSDTKLLGTENFAAPEQFMKNTQTDHRTDIYSLGATLYYLLSNGQYYHLLKKPLHDITRQISPEVCDVVMKCLQYELHDRYQSALEVKEALLKIQSTANSGPIENQEKMEQPQNKQKGKKEKQSKVKTERTYLQRVITKFKIMSVIILLVAVSLFGTYKYLEYKYSAATMITQLKSAIESKNVADVQNVLASDDEEFTISTKAIESFVSLLAEDEKELNRFIGHLNLQANGQNGYDDLSAFELVKANKLFNMINSFEIVVHPVSFAVKSNQIGAELFVNDELYSTIETDVYEQIVGPFMPGVFKIALEGKSEYTTFSDSRELKLFERQEPPIVDFNIQGTTISIQANYQLAEVFVNGEPTKLTISKASNFGPVSTDGSMEIHLEQTFPWGKIKSEPQVITRDGHYNFELEPLNDELRQSIIKIGNEHLLSVIDMYKTKDLTKLKHVTPNATNLYQNNLTKRSVDNTSAIEKLTKVRYDLDTFDFYETSVNEYEVAVNVSYLYDAKITTEGVNEKTESRQDNQKMLFIYDNALKQWIIKDTISTNASPLVNTIDYDF